MKRLLLFAALSVFLTGCISYRGGSVSGDYAGNQANIARGTSGVSDGADPGPGITGSDAVPQR